MAFALDISSVDTELKRKISKELSVKPKKTQYEPDPQPKYVFAANRQEGVLYLPLGQYTEYLNDFPHSFDEYSQTDLEFVFDLFTAETDPSGRGRDQQKVVRQAISRLEEKHTVFISAYTGYGKTATATYLIVWSKLKAMVICHNDTLKRQWKDEIIRFTGGKAIVQIVQGRKPLDPNAHIYIIGVRKASTLDRNDMLDIGMVVVDEAHICTVTAFTKSLLKFQPMYLVGLSATPDRVDGLHSMLHICFGDSKEFIVREEVKNFTVIKYQTSYKPEISYTMVRGKVTVAWTNMMTSLAEIEGRWKEIANLAISHPEHKIMILCNRQSMAVNIYNLLGEEGESTEILIGSKKTWDKSKRVLVAGVMKGGVGLNDPDLTMLIIAADMKDVRQCEGRIRTTDNLVYDIVDDYSTLEKHWQIREKWYQKRGAIVEIGGVERPTVASKGSSGGSRRFLPSNT